MSLLSVIVVVVVVSAAVVAVLSFLCIALRHVSYLEDLPTPPSNFSPTISPISIIYGTYIEQNGPFSECCSGVICSSTIAADLGGSMKSDTYART